MRILLAFVAFTLFYGCSNPELDFSFPTCLDDSKELWIENFDAQPCGESEVSIDQFYFEGQVVYLLPESCFYDVGSQLLDANCNLIGAVGCRCGSIIKDFHEEASFVQQVWSYP